MKILFLANRLPHENIAGGHRLVYQRMRWLAGQGHDIGLAAFVEPGKEMVKNKYSIQSAVRELEQVLKEVVSI